MLVLLHLFVSCVLVLLGFYVFVANPRSRANQTFAAFIAFLAAWNTKDLIFWNFHDESISAEWWIAASFVIALLMQYSLVVFAWVFPENSRTPRKRAAVLFSPGLILIPAAVSGSLWTSAEFIGDRFSIEFTALAYFFVAYIYFLFIYGGVVLFRKYLSLRGTQQGQQLASILWALVITGVLITVSNVVLPMLGVYALLPFSAVFILPGVLIYAYAILNFRLFSLQSVLDQFRLFPLAYKVALIIASVAIVSFLIFQIPIVAWAFQSGMSFEAWRRYLVFSIIAAMIPNLLIVLLVVRTISRPLHRIAVAAVKVTNGEYGTQVDLRKSNDEIGVLADSFNNMSRKLASDIDQIREMNEHLVRTDRLAAMGTLSAGVAHEVNNPLASISSLIQMLQNNGSANGETVEMLTLISEQIERISRVTKDLTGFARVRPAARKPVNTNEILDSALRLASFSSVSEKIEIAKNYYADLPLISADPDELQQVFLNLFLNAFDAMPEGGRLNIATRAAGDSVIVDIADTGSGISDSEAKHIFDPFFTTKPAGKGTGLGLAVCYGVVTAHGGTIELSRTGSDGSTFRVKLPV
jgi:signal transduction histidine kinase